MFPKQRRKILKHTRHYRNDRVNQSTEITYTYVIHKTPRIEPILMQDQNMRAETHTTCNMNKSFTQLNMTDKIDPMSGLGHCEER